jgi:hypothetical protein
VPASESLLAIKLTSFDMDLFFFTVGFPTDNLQGTAAPLAGQSLADLHWLELKMNSEQFLKIIDNAQRI